MQPTAEQQEIIAAAVSTADNLLINALAGAAKTTTLELICKALPSSMPILSVAFNKRIATEMEKRLPGNVRCQTLNSVGHRIWQAAVGRRLFVDSKKSYNLLKEKVDALPRQERSEAWETFGETLRAISAAKAAGYVPEGKFPHAKRLISREDFYASLEDPVAEGFVEEVLAESIALAYKGTIDFDDQIYMPTLFGGTFPQAPLVMVDEAQDLSPLNHAMLEKLATRRLIAVGDPWQSIYAFRGADTASMARLRDRFAMREMTLSISFRCPIEIVKRAHWRVPHMQWPDWAKPGHVVQMDHWSINDIPDGAAIICRNNGPLFRMALTLIRAGRGCVLVGTDLGPQLIRALKRLGDLSMTQHQVYEAIARWEEDRLKKSKAKASIHDRAECLRVFASFGQSLGEALTYAERLFAAKGPIQLLSGHKAKGLEWDHVFHLDPWRIPSGYAETEDEINQEKNVRYVIETRARDSLYLVDLEKFSAPQT